VTWAFSERLLLPFFTGHVLAGFALGFAAVFLAEAWRAGLVGADGINNIYRISL